MDDDPPLAHPPEPPPTMPTVMPSCTRCALRMDTIGYVSWSLFQQPECPCMATRHPGRSYNPRSRRWLTCGGCDGDGNVGVPVYTVKEQCPGCVIDGVLISHREVVVERDNPAAERRRVRERARAEAMARARARARARGPRGRGGRRRSRSRGGLPPPPPGCAGCRYHWREPPAPSRMVRIVRWLFAAPSWRVAAPRYRRRPLTPPFWRSSVSRNYRRRFTPSYRGSCMSPRRAYRGTSVSSYDSPYDTPYERPYKKGYKRQYRRKYSRPPQRNRRGPHQRRHQRPYREDYRRPRDSYRGPWAWTQWDSHWQLRHRQSW